MAVITGNSRKKNCSKFAPEKHALELDTSYFVDCQFAEWLEKSV